MREKVVVIFRFALAAKCAGLPRISVIIFATVCLSLCAGREVRRASKNQYNHIRDCVRVCVSTRVFFAALVRVILHSDIIAQCFFLGGECLKLSRRAARER